MTQIVREILESAKKLGYIITKFKIYDGAEVVELKLCVRQHKNMCFTNFCIEMGYRGYIETQWINLSDTHFIVKFVKT